VLGYILDLHPTMVGLEDYKLGGRNQYVSYQIAEVAALLKNGMLNAGIRYVLINPRKRMSYVRHQRNVPKDMVIEYAAAHGFQPPVRSRSNPGYDKRQREDLADAYVLGRMTRDLWVLLSEHASSRRGDIFLDPRTGLAYRSDLLFNLQALGSPS
jgi:hypothetical protein